MKRGERPLDPIKEDLSNKLNYMKELELKTDLPVCNEAFKKDFDKWLVVKLREFYNL